MEKGRLHFKTAAAANLFAVEITGQLSDGAWENTRPLDHWKFWCDADIIIDGLIGHRGSPSKTNYNVSSLKKYIKDYMLDAIRVSKMPWYDISWADYSRGLVDGFLLKDPNYHSSWFIYPYKPKTAEQIRETYGFLLDSKVNKAAETLGPHTSEEFKKALYDEVIRQMIQDEEEHFRFRQEWMKKHQQKLATIGIHSEDDLREMAKRIKAVTVTDAELDEALLEVKKMFSTKL